MMFREQILNLYQKNYILMLSIQNIITDNNNNSDIPTSRKT